jgi:hypothetical protein
MNDVDKTIRDNENVCGEFTSYNSLWYSPIMLQIMFHSQAFCIITW